MKPRKSGRPGYFLVQPTISCAFICSSRQVNFGETDLDDLGDLVKAPRNVCREKFFCCDRVASLNCENDFTVLVLRSRTLFLHVDPADEVDAAIQVLQR